MTANDGIVLVTGGPAGSGVTAINLPVDAGFIRVRCGTPMADCGKLQSLS